MQKLDFTDKCEIDTFASMIIVTGAAGFIGSYVSGWLLAEGYKDLVLVDDFSHKEKTLNYIHKPCRERVERDVFFEWVRGKEKFIQAIIHLGARTNTAEFDEALLNRLNYTWTRQVWELCTEQQIPLIYASSAATYGDGAFGYGEDIVTIRKLKPLNPYGWSKQKFDLWALEQTQSPFFWAGLKFFNVYGPNEYHKGRMASVIFHAWKQIKDTGKMSLFRSHKPDFRDGEQLRDFIYVQDVAKVIQFLMESRTESGIYNLGTGRARTFYDLASGVFQALDKPVQIDFIDIPEDIRNTYQYYTEADMHHLRSVGFKDSFMELEEGILEYVRNYLETGLRIY